MNKTSAFIVGICFFGTFLVANAFLDPDFFWHIRHGMDILNRQFSLTDQYSYTMSSFKFVNHSWLTSVVWAVIYYKLHLGYAGVAAFCALMATTAAFVSSGGLLWLMPLVAASYLDGGDVRTNVITFLCLSLLILLFQKSRLQKHYLFFIPALLFFWANLHGGFVIGVIYIWGYFLIDIVLLSRKAVLRKETLLYLLLSILSTAVTFVTPYQMGTWIEALRTINNPLLTSYVSEWQPMYRLASFSFVPIIALFSISLYYTRKFGWLEIFSCLLLLDSFLSVRMAPLYCVSAAFIITKTYRHFIEEKRQKIDMKRLNKTIFILTLFSITLFCLESIINIRNRVVVSRSAYPTLATEYLSKHMPKGNMFAPIHWNSYLLWKIPEKKDFVDGRMLVWSQANIPNELDSAFSEYLAISFGKKNINEFLDTFCITTLIWPTYEHTALWVPTVAPVDITSNLDKQVWKNVYHDTDVVIYERALPVPCFTHYE